MFANEKSEESGSYGFGMAEIKRFFQWILGCTYAKKTFKTRMAEMFHFADAPHIVVYERSEERPWYWMVGIITAVLIAVLSLYYTLEAGFRAIRKFMLSVIREAPQSTVSTPRCLSPTTSSSKKTSPQTPKTPEIIRQKVAMNEPVNCVFIRPAIPKLAPEGPPINVPNLNSEEDVTVDADQVMVQNNKEKKEKEKSGKEKKEKKKGSNKSPPAMRLDEVKFDASSNFNIRPTMAPSPSVHTNSTQPSNRKSTGSEDANLPQSSHSECDQINEWVMQQIAGCIVLEEAERTNAGVCESEVISDSDSMIKPQGVSSDFLEKIQQLIEAHLGQSSVMEASSDENISEMSIVTESIMSSLAEIDSSIAETHVTETSEIPVNTDESFARQTEGNEDDADIVIDDSRLFADSDNECDGSILVREGQQKVLFRWTDENPNTVDSVTLTGTFFGWNMNIPMKRSGVKTFEVCIELPVGMHDYLINVFRFD